MEVKMLNRLSSILATLSLLFLFLNPSQANAATWTYVFQGTIDQSSRVESLIQSDSILFADAGLMVGNTVTFKFFIDTNAPGSYTRYDGSVYTYYDHWEMWGEPNSSYDQYYDYFFAEYLSGDALGNISIGPFQNSTNIASRHHGLNESGDFGPSAGISAFSQNNPLSITSLDKNSSYEWQLGDFFF